MPHSEAGLLSMTSSTAMETWYAPRAPEHQSPHKYDLHDFAVERIGRNANVHYLEFGVHEGAAIRRFASIFSNESARFVGFDSFVGLPEQWSDMTAGHFSTGGQAPQIPDDRVRFVKGWFQNTIGSEWPYLAAEPHDAVLVHFDADLYSSTLFLLTSLWWHIPEYFFIFDEFAGQELAAVRHFTMAYPVEVEFFTRVDSQTGHHPVQIFGKLRAVEMVVG